MAHWRSPKLKNVGRAVRRALLTLSAVLVAIVGIAQEDGRLPPHMVDEGRRMLGDSIRFCILEDGLTADFDLALAAELASVLLLEVEVRPVSAYHRSRPLDYRPNLLMEEIHLYLAERCEAFLGFTVAQGYPDWLSIGRPYLRTRFVLAATEGDVTALRDIPAGTPIGFRYLSSADIQFAMFLETLPLDDRWRRVPYPDNQILIDRLLDGTLDVAILWEPALFVATGGDPASHDIHLIAADPYRPPEVRFAVGLLSRDTFLRTMLDAAVVELIESGAIERLLEEHGLPGEPAPVGR
jgi:polar amino acid transport system substrate-binding protein